MKRLRPFLQTVVVTCFTRQESAAAFFVPTTFLAALPLQSSSSSPSPPTSTSLYQAEIDDQRPSDTSERYPNNTSKISPVQKKPSPSQKRRQRIVNEARSNKRKEEEASAAMDLPEQPILQTIPGGSEMIFKMARSLLLWEADDASKNTNNQSNNQNTIVVQTTVDGAPRWHPTNGISDNNPQFRTQSPVMNQQGYAGSIWRNVRKRSKPSMWKYALRTYDRMAQGTVETDSNSSSATIRIPRTNIHHEGALLACAKLGQWERAVEIYEAVQLVESQARARLATNKDTVSVSTKKREEQQKASFPVHVSDNMVLSVVRACVRAVRLYRGPTTAKNLAERRTPLDKARCILLEIGDRHKLPLVARHLNPLVSAYQSLGLVPEASELLQTCLTDRTIGPESENGEDPFNVHDLLAKDKASYSLLVRGAVSSNDWVGAVDALRDMTEAGVYPTTRHVNEWTEVSERKTKQRTTRSWKKKRDELWLDCVQ